MNSVGQRLLKAHSFLATAEKCLETRDWESAASRAYYAAYHASAAFLEWHPNVPEKPSDEWREKEIRTGLARYFAPKLRGKKRAHELFWELLGTRIAGDYRVGSLGSQRAVNSVKIAKELIQMIEDELVRLGAIPHGEGE